MKEFKVTATAESLATAIRVYFDWLDAYQNSSGSSRAKAQKELDKLEAELRERSGWNYSRL